MVYVCAYYHMYNERYMYVPILWERNMYIYDVHTVYVCTYTIIVVQIYIFLFILAKSQSHMQKETFKMMKGFGFFRNAQHFVKFVTMSSSNQHNALMATNSTTNFIANAMPTTSTTNFHHYASASIGHLSNKLNVCIPIF